MRLSLETRLFLALQNNQKHRPRTSLLATDETTCPQASRFKARGLFGIVAADYAAPMGGPMILRLWIGYVVSVVGAAVVFVLLGVAAALLGYFPRGHSSTFLYS